MELIYFSYFGCKFKIRTNAMHEHVINNHEHVKNAFKHIKNIQVYSKNFNNQLACLFLKLKNIYKKTSSWKRIYLHAKSTQWKMRLMVVLRREGVLTYFLESKEDQGMARFLTFLKILGEDEKKK